MAADQADIDDLVRAKARRRLILDSGRQSITLPDQQGSETLITLSEVNDTIERLERSIASAAGPRFLAGRMERMGR